MGLKTTLAIPPINVVTPIMPVVKGTHQMIIKKLRISKAALNKRLPHNGKPSTKIKSKKG